MHGYPIMEKLQKELMQEPYIFAYIVLVYSISARKVHRVSIISAMKCAIYCNGWRVVFSCPSFRPSFYCRVVFLCVPPLPACFHIFRYPSILLQNELPSMQKGFSLLYVVLGGREFEMYRLSKEQSVTTYCHPPHTAIGSCCPLDSLTF